MSWTQSDAPAISQLPFLHDLCEHAAAVVSATDRLRTAIEQLKAERAHAVADLRRAVLTLGAVCPQEQRAELARVLYWRHTEVPIGDITVAFGLQGQRELAAVAGSVRSGAACEQCGRVLIASSRRELAEQQRATDQGAVCPACRTRRERVFYEHLMSEPPDELYEDDPEAWGYEVLS